MIMVDDLIVNPEEAPMTPARTSVSLSEMGISVLEFRPGESTIEGTSIRTAQGQRLVDRRAKAATMELILMVREDRAEEVDLPAAAYRLQQIFGSMQERETWIMRVPYVGGDFAGPLLYKITGVVSLGDFLGWGKGEQPDVKLVLERDPVGYSTEEEESEVFKATTARQLVYTLPPSKGTAQGLQRVRVTNEGTEDWRGLIWAEECRDAPDDLSDPTAALAYLAKNLTPMGEAAVATVSGAEVVQHTALTAGWLTILSSEIVGVGHMTHRGARRIRMRIYDPGAEAGNVQLRLLWRPLGASRWVEDNPTVSTAVVGNYSIVDLGMCRPQQAELGDERWEWRLIARALSGSGAVRIRDVYPLPTEQYAVASEPYVAPIADLQSVEAPATAESVDLEGAISWSNPANIVSSDDSRATCTFPGLKEGRFSDYLVARNFGFALPEGALVTGVLVSIERSVGNLSGGRDRFVRLMKGGAIQAPNRGWHGIWPTTESAYYYGGSDDLWDNTWTAAQINSANFGVALAIEVTSIAGESATFRVDQIKMTIYYAEAGQEEDKVCFANGRSLEFRPNGVYRQHREDGDVWGALVPDGFLPYVAVGGLEERPSRGIVIPTQGDLLSLPDAGTPNKASVVVSGRAGYHFARGPA